MLNWLLKNPKTPQPNIAMDTNLGTTQAVDTYSIQWTVKEATSILECENKARLYGTFEGFDGPQSFQTVLLNADLATNTFVLDYFHPRTLLRTLYSSGVFQLTIPSSIGAEHKPISLRCIAMGEQSGLDGGGIIIKVLEKTQDLPRPLKVAFLENTAPKCRLLVPLTGQFTGVVKAITPLEFELTTPTLANLELREQRGDCSIYFSESFTFNSKVKIKDIKHRRKPHNHSRLLLSFTHSEINKREQLQAFITMLDTKLGSVQAS